MPDNTKHEHKGKPHSKEIKPRVEDHTLASNDNAIAAAATARAGLTLLQPGKVWNHTAPRGEREIKGSLELDSQPVIMLRFSPADGRLLPKGLHGLNESTAETMAIVEAKLKSLATELVVLDGAEFREPECCWALPIAHQGRIVAHIKVSADGSTVLPDRKAAEEILSS
ncbi:MAG: hypothetical protein WCT03_12765 [Candidatus Obscuribacterales bacterium]|jgi:hypothetical protein